MNALKEEVESVSKKLHELSKEELEKVSGGIDNVESCPIYCIYQAETSNEDMRLRCLINCNKMCGCQLSDGCAVRATAVKKYGVYSPFIS